MHHHRAFELQHSLQCLLAAWLYGRIAAALQMVTKTLLAQGMSR